MKPMALTHPSELLRPCIVRIMSGVGGTGFFVAPGMVLTCAHVIENTPGSSVNVQYAGRILNAKVERCVPEINSSSGLFPFPDISVVRLREPVAHPCVLINRASPQVNERLYTLGYTTTLSPMPTEEPTTFIYEGPHKTSGGYLMKLSQGDALRGMSGAPLLSLNPTTVCALIKTSRDDRGSRGGWAIPIEAVLQSFPDIEIANQEFHNMNSQWLTLAQELTGKGQADDLVVDLTAVRERTPSLRPAGILFTLTNTGGNHIKIPSIKLQVLRIAETQEPHHYLPEGIPEQFSISASLRPRVENHELLEVAHVLRPGESEGYSLEIKAVEGWIYSVRLKVSWGRVGTRSHQTWVGDTIDLPFRITNRNRLMDIARQLKG